MHTIHLHSLIFFSFHGIHEEEKIIGNNFEVNIDVNFIHLEPITDLQQTINYVTIYEVVKKRMAIATPLLETLVESLAAKIYLLDKRIQKISISIKKINAPIENFSGVVGVSYQKEYPIGNL
jgi:dihydroneopterin aldolase